MTEEDLKKWRVDAIVKAIARIPASGGGVIDLYPATLSQKLSNDMIVFIATKAVEAITEPPGAPQDKPEEPAVRKCIVKGCQNHSDAGRMVGPLCAPCDNLLRQGEDALDPRGGGRGITFIHKIWLHKLLAEGANTEAYRALAKAR